MASRLKVTVHDEPGWNYALWRSAFHDVTEALGASYMVYNQRVVPVSCGKDRETEYWALRRGVAMTDVSGERTTEIVGPDAERLMDLVMPRPMTKFNPGRAMYGLLCRPDGGVLCDGVLVRPAPDCFWYISALGDVESWLLANATGLDAMDIRRIEAGILLNGSDMDASLNPFQAGLGNFIDMTKPVFVGKSALEEADRTPLVSGLLCADDEPLTGGVLFEGDEDVGWVTAAAYSPYLQSGTAIVRLRRAVAIGSNSLTVETRKAGHAPSRLATLPLYDAEHRIVRGLDTAVP